MPPSTILLVRHGQSQANAGGVTLENSLVPLTKLGELQAQALAPLLPSTAADIWSSPFRRALDTATPYCERIAQPAARHDDLREFEVIDTLQMRGSAFTERNAAVVRFWETAEPDHRMGPTAETFREFHERIARVRTHWLPNLADGTVIFGHGMWMALLFWQMWGFERNDHAAMIRFRRFQLGFPMPNAALYNVTSVAAGKWAIKADEAAMRALAAIGAGLDQRAHEDTEFSAAVSA
jgi:alpha-ribazole phosphatase